MTTTINSNVHFSAVWTPQNESLKSTLTQKVSRFALNLLHKLAMSICLPATHLFKKDDIKMAKQQFSAIHADQYLSKDITVTTPDGARLQGTFLQKKGCPENAPCVIFMQPNAALYAHNAFDSIVRNAWLEGKQCNFLFFDYRGCGLSEGSPLQAKDLVIDGDSMYQFARDHLQVPADDIHMMGSSFGGGVTAQVKAMHPECKGNYVNDRSFSCITQAAEHMLGGGIIGKIAKVFLKILGWKALDSAQALSKIDSRTLITHHPEDRIIRNKAQLVTAASAQKDNIEHMDLTTKVRSNNYHCIDLRNVYLSDASYAADKAANFLLSGVAFEDVWPARINQLKHFDELTQKSFSSHLQRRYYPNSEQEDIYSRLHLPENEGGIPTQYKIHVLKNWYLSRPTRGE